ncbi:MAG: MFS transporter [Aeromicrobium sp.]
MRRPVMWEVLTNSNRFGIFFVGAALSNIGTWCQNLAGILLVYRLSDSTLVVSFVTVCQFAAPVILAPWGGYAADRFDRRRVLICTQLAGSVLSACLAITTMTGHVTVVGVLFMISLLGVCQAFQSPAQLSFTPLMVPPEQRELGLSLSSSQFNIARAIGPVVANVVILKWGIGQAFLFNTFSFFAYVIALTFFVRPFAQQRLTAVPKLRETIDTVRAEPLIVPLLLTGVVISGSTDIVSTLGPALSTSLTGDDGATGYFLSAFGTGAVVTAFFLVPWLRRFPRRLVWTIAAQSVGVLLMAVSPVLWLTMVGAAIMGGAFLASSNRAVSLVQSLVPPQSLGRVMAVWLVAFLGGRPVFALLSGLVTHVASARVAALIISLVLAASALAMLSTARRLRRLQDTTKVGTRSVDSAARPLSPSRKDT